MWALAPSFPVGVHRAGSWSRTGRVWGGAFPLAGEVQGRARILEEALELFAQFLLCLEFSLQPSFFLQIHPGIYCFCFLRPAPDFWAALPQEGAFGRLGGSCHASKHPSGILPASRWIQPGPVPSRAAPRPVACAVTWGEPPAQPHPSAGPGRDRHELFAVPLPEAPQGRLAGIQAVPHAELAGFALCPPL